MRRILALVSLFAASLAPALAQSCKAGYAQVVATMVQNVKGDLLPSGSFTITGIDAQRQAMNFSAPGGGVITKSSVKAAVANGSIVGNVCVPRSDLSSQYVRYHITITDNSASGTRAVLVDANDIPITTDIFSLDGYSFPANAYANPPNSFTNGQVNGNLSVTGSISAGSINASTATNSQHAVQADTATVALNATHAAVADAATHATTADSATSASSASTAASATTAISATNASHAAAADQATHAASADTATMASAAASLASVTPCGLNSSGVQQIMIGFSAGGVADCVDPAAGGSGGGATPAGAQFELQAKDTATALRAFHGKTDATGNQLYLPDTMELGGVDGQHPEKMKLGYFGTSFGFNRDVNTGTFYDQSGVSAFQVTHHGAAGNPGADLLQFQFYQPSGGANGQALALTAEGNVRLGGTGCDVYAGNPDSYHPQAGVGTCAPNTIYGVSLPNASAFKVFNPQGGDSYLAAHSTGSGRPHFHLWGEGLGGAFDASIDPTGNFTLDNINGPSIHHTSLVCNDVNPVSGTPYACRFPYGYDGTFVQNTTNAFTPGPNGFTWAGTYANTDWKTSPEYAVTVLGTGSPNYGSVDVKGYFVGGYNEFNPAPGASNFFKSNVFGINGVFVWPGQGQHQIMPMAAYCWGVGDCIAGEDTLFHHGGGMESAAEQVHGRRVNTQEDPHTAIGLCSGPGCTAGSTTFSLAGGDALNTLGEGHYMADLTASVTNPGRIAGALGQDPTTFLQVNQFNGSNFPVSAMYLVSGAVPSAATGPAPGLVTIAIKTSGLPAGYLSTTAGKPSTGLACTYDRRGPAGQIGARYTLVDATHIQVNLRVGLSDGAMIALGGMCGYGIDPAGDQVLPQGGNVTLHAIAGVFASPTANTVLLHSATHLGSDSGGHAEYVNSLNVRNFVRTGGVASFDLSGFRPDLVNGMTLPINGGASGIAGVTLSLNMTAANGFNSGTSHFTAPDARANLALVASPDAHADADFAQFAVVPIAETLDVRDVNNIVVGDNLMPLNPGDQIIQTHTEVQSNGDAAQDIDVTFSPQADNPVHPHGCADGGQINSFMDAGLICYEVDNETADSQTLGFGGRHRAPGAQFIQRGHFTGAADWEIDRFGTVITVEPSNGDLAHWGPIRFVDFGASNTADNSWTFTPNPDTAQFSSLSFGFMNMSGTGTMTYPIYNVGPDGAPTVVISHTSGTGTYTTVGNHYAHALACGSPLVQGAPVALVLGATWSNTSGIETLTLTATTPPAADTTVTLSCAYVP